MSPDPLLFRALACSKSHAVKHPSSQVSLCSMTESLRVKQYVLYSSLMMLAHLFVVLIEIPYSCVQQCLIYFSCSVMQVFIVLCVVSE